MQFDFMKMHGLGNDFVVVDATQQTFSPTVKKIQELSNRRTGIGFDQLLVVDPASSKEVDFDYRIFNADGNEVMQCGNGARCFARFVSLKQLSKQKTMRAQTAERIIEMHLEDNQQVSVNMGLPIFEPARIPFLCAKSQADIYAIELSGKTLALSALSFGNPHAVIVVDDLRTATVIEIGSKLQSHKCFPQGVNVGFMKIEAEHLQLRVYERGVGETPACGSGACAAAVVAHKQQLISKSDIAVHLTGGMLSVRCEDDGVKLTGPAEPVYEGQLTI